MNNEITKDKSYRSKHIDDQIKQLLVQWVILQEKLTVLD